MSGARLGSVAGFALVVAACVDLSLQPAVNRIPEAIANPSFSADIAPVLAETCASSAACHGGTRNYGLDLRPENAYASLVNVTSAVRAPMLRVRPGQPDSSFFYRVLSTDVNYRLGYPYRMPLTEYPLPAPVVETIRNWIAGGARDN